MLLPVGKGSGPIVLIAGTASGNVGFGSGITGLGYPGVAFGSLPKQPLGVLDAGVRLEYFLAPSSGGVIDFYLSGAPSFFNTIYVDGVNYPAAFFSLTTYGSGARRYRYSFGGSFVRFVDGSNYVIRFE